MPDFSTACPRNCYSSCSFKARIEDGKLIAVLPHAENKATFEGPCIKGLSYVERAHSSDRIVYPLKRNSIGDFERISWDDALSTISDKLKFYKENFGQKSVLFYASSGMAGMVNAFSDRFWELYGGATTTYGNLCWPAGLEAVRLTLGENKHNAPWDIEHAGLIILWGKNPAETNIQQMVFIERAQASGAKVIVIDPRRTPSSERADLLIQPKPGTDAAIALAVANYLIENKKFDAAFVDKHVLGFDRFSDSIREWTLEKASQISGVPVQFIQILADELGSGKPTTIAPGYGMQRFTNGGQTTRALLALNVITGNIGKKGACYHYANLQSYVFDKIKEPESYYPEIGVNPSFRRSISKARLGEDMLNTNTPELKMIWVERGNPITQNPDTNTILKAFNKLEFKVVVDQFMTDTAREADIILPAKNMFEQSDIIGGYWNPYVQLKPKLLDEAGEVKTETEIYYQLAEKLGYSKSEIEEYLPKPGNEHIESYLKEVLKTEPTLSWEALQKGPVIVPGHEEIAFFDMRFNTPSGKIELYSEEAENIWGVNKLPDFKPLMNSEKRDVFPFMLMSPNTKNRIHSQFGNLKIIKQFTPGPTIIISSKNAVEKGIMSGEQIRVYNDEGELFGKVEINFSLLKGCVVYYNGWWLQEGGTPNLLSKGLETDMGHGTAFHDTRVNIEKLR